MDFLERKIKEQREEFDHIERVDEGLLWQSIQVDLNPPQEAKVIRSDRFLRLYAIAASVAILLMASWIFYQKNETPPTVVEHEVQNFIPFAEEENYQRTVSEKKETLDFNNVDRKKFHEIFTELDELENMHQEFRADLPQISDEERAVLLLRKYYERKIRILERLSKEIEKESHHEKRINEKPQI